MTGSATNTPMMRQYQQMKAHDPSALLLFRMGDFYELFGEDAQRGAELLNLTLTSRDKDKGDDAVPMAGFPHHQLESYLAKLVEQGVRAAVCDQVEDPKQAKGLVRREIVRVVTPGTLTDEALLDPRAANYLAAVVELRAKLGLAWVDLSTGRFQVAQLRRNDLAEELARLQPAEILISETAESSPWVRTLREQIGLNVTPRPSWDFQPEQATQGLYKHFRVTTVSGFGLVDDTPEVTAAGALLAYLYETQKAALNHLHKLSAYRREHILSLDETTRRSLELVRTLREGRRDGSLLHAIDRTTTSMGARLLAEWLMAPRTDLETIHARHESVAELVGDTELRVGLREHLESAADLERLAARVGTGRASPRDLVALARTLALLPPLKARITSRESARLNQLEEALELCPEIRNAIRDTLVDEPPMAVREGGLIRPGYHPTLDELREAAKGGKTWIARYQNEQIRETGITSLKIKYNKVFGYFIEVGRSHESRVPDHYIRKQTVKNAERYKTAELEEYEDKVLKAEDRAKELEYELFLHVRDRVAAEAPRLIQAGAILAELDVLASLAELATRQGYCRPTMVEEPELQVEAGRHPVLDVLMPHGAFVPNDTALAAEPGAAILLITGPNMAGKSTYIRQVALICLLAQIGSFVPARSARLGIVDRLFARVGATDELGRGQSTFMVEMTETANILNNATTRSLVILDEIGRGTSTFDGISLAWAITEHLHDQIGCRTLFATHYHELVDLAQSKPRLRNANVLVRERDGQILFLHQIGPGGADQSYGIHVARIAGVPNPVLDRAREILAFLERQHAGDRPLEEYPNQSDEPVVTHPSAEHSQDDPVEPLTSVASVEETSDTNTTEVTPPKKPMPAPGRVKTGRALRGLSLFADLPDPVLDELRQVDPDRLSPDEALQLVRRLKVVADETHHGAG